LNSTYVLKETARESAFEAVWANDINDVFADVAPYYDRANIFATLGLIDRLRDRFVSTIDVRPGQKVLDVCAGTNAIGVGLLEKQSDLEIHAADRSVAMQEVGRARAQRLGFDIKSHICDVHRLPFPDNHFDVVTLQWATRHLRVIDVVSEIKRVLKPGGCFYHCDMLRPANKLVEDVYCLYLTACVSTIARAFGSNEAAKKCRRYFVDAIRLFYSVEELSRLLAELGYSDVRGRSVLAGTVGFHTARKP
jgi:demethylmenaquinone methyltransferase/2-methoxy-6-polyprenyl-1,4-benzoquinol methylase